MRRAALGAGVLLACGVAWYAWHGAARSAVTYVTATVKKGTIASSVVASGAVNPETTIQVGTYVSGVIVSIQCDFNTRVKAGQLCARIDPRPYQTMVEQEQAALATARAQLQKDRTNLAYAASVDARNTGLLQRGIVSQETADASHSAYLEAGSQVLLDQATVRQREAQSKAAGINLGYTYIVSPVDGTVVSRNVTQGQTVAASFQTPTLFLIATDLTRMQVDANVSESDIGRVAVGNRATFTVSAYPDRQFNGVVRQLRQAPQTVQNVVTYDVVVSAPNPALLLKPGMTASVHIIGGQRDDVLMVPGQALRYRPAALPAASPVNRAQRDSVAGPQGQPAGAKSHVWVLESARPRRVEVATGLDDDANIEVVSGALKEGDAVIVAERAAAGSPPRSPAGLVPGR